MSKNDQTFVVDFVVVYRHYRKCFLQCSKPRNVHFYAKFFALPEPCQIDFLYQQWLFHSKDNNSHDPKLL